MSTLGAVPASPARPTRSRAATVTATAANVTATIARPVSSLAVSAAASKPAPKRTSSGSASLAPTA